MVPLSEKLLTLCNVCHIFNSDQVAEDLSAVCQQQPVFKRVGQRLRSTIMVNLKANDDIVLHLIKCVFLPKANHNQKS